MNDHCLAAEGAEGAERAAVAAVVNSPGGKPALPRAYDEEPCLSPGRSRGA
jgi:hypothetical protein